MTRVQSFQGGTKPLTASATQTVIFTPFDLESAGLTRLFFAFGTAAGTFATVNRVRVRAGPDLLMDCTRTELQALQQAYSKRMVADLDANQFFTVPFFLLDGPTENDQDICQFPPGREIQVEIDITTIAGAGQSIYAGWELSSIPPVYYPRYYSQVLNFVGGTNNNRYPLVEAGFVRGVTLTPANVTRAELFISGKSAFRMPGPTYGGAAAAGDMLNAKDYFDDGITITTKKHRKVSLESVAAPGNSYILMDVAAGWTTAESLGIYSLVPLPKSS